LRVVAGEVEWSRGEVVLRREVVRPLGNIATW